MPRPDPARVPDYFHKYINQVQENDLMDALQKQQDSFLSFLETVTAEKSLYRYAEGKWSIKEVVQHIIDTERIFIYRALCFARKETASLPGFDENAYADNSAADKRDWQSLIDEFRAVRNSAVLLFRSFNEEQLNSGGISNGNSNYVLGLGFIIAGHVTHHASILKERYI